MSAFLHVYTGFLAGSNRTVLFPSCVLNLIKYFMQYLRNAGSLALMMRV